MLKDTKLRKEVKRKGPKQKVNRTSHSGNKET